LRWASNGRRAIHIWHDSRATHGKLSYRGKYLLRWRHGVFRERKNRKLGMNAVKSDRKKRKKKERNYYGWNWKVTILRG